MNSKIAIVRCSNYDPYLVQEKVEQAIDLIGGIENFIRPESKVLIKPNLLMAIEPEFGVDTHPEVARAVIKILKEIKCQVYLGDGPSAWGSIMENVDEVYERSGMKRVCQEEGIELVKFKNYRWREKFPLTTRLDDSDYIVSIPKFKTHDTTILTAAIKNLFGLVSGTYKVQLHKKYFEVEAFSKILVDIYQKVRPALTVVDGIVAMEGDGPGTSGKLRNVGLLFAGSDGVALDSVLALIMGLKPEDIPTTREAAKRGLGIADINRIDIMGEKLENIIEEPFQLPATSMLRKIPRPVINLAKKLIKYYPCVDEDNCINCTACIQVCPNKAIAMKNNRIVFDYAKCISCFCCQEACPASAIKVKKSLLAKVIGL